jgi:DNA-binding transcriptional MerR regulator
MAVAARLTAMHPQTLRKYERAGLIEPSRPSGNQRLYSEADIRRLKRIRYLVEVRGVNIAGLELTLKMTDRLDALEPEATADELRTAIGDVSDMGREPRGEGPGNDQEPPMNHLDMDELHVADQEPGATRILTEEGWEDASFVDPDDDWRLLEDGSWTSPDGRTRTWLAVGPEPPGPD